MTPDLEVLREFSDTGFVPYETEYSRNFTPKHLLVIASAMDTGIKREKISDTDTKLNLHTDLPLLRRCIKSSIKLDLSSNVASEDENFSRYCKSTLRHYSQNDDPRKINSSFTLLILNSCLNDNVIVKKAIRKNKNGFVSVYMKDFK